MLVGDGSVALDSSVDGGAGLVEAGDLGMDTPQASRRAPKDRAPAPTAAVFKKSLRVSLDIIHLSLDKSY